MISSSISPLRILIIEDDPLMPLGLKHALSRYSHLEIIGQEEDGMAAVQSGAMYLDEKVRHLVHQIQGKTPDEPRFTLSDRVQLQP